MSTLLNALMPHCHGASASMRLVLSGAVKVNGYVVTNPDREVYETDIIVAGKTRVIQVFAKPYRIDPEGCGCTDCLTGYSVPIDCAEVRTFDACVLGHVYDASSTTPEEFSTWLNSREFMEGL